MKKIVLIFFTVLGLGVGLLTTVNLVKKGYELNRLTGAHLTVAQYSPTPELMELHLNNAVHGMEVLEMTTGYSALYFKTEANNMANLYKILVDARNSLHQINTTEVSDPEQQFDNVQDAISGLYIPSFAYWWRHSSAGMNMVIGCWIGWIVFVVAGIWSLFASLE